MADESWYYAMGQNQVGPVPTSQLRQLVQSGQVNPDSLVWREGMPNWTPAGSIPELMVSSGVASAISTPAYHSPAMGVPAGNLNYFAAAGEAQYAGFWLRFCAAFIDGLLFAICLSIPMAVLGYLITGASPIGNNQPNPMNPVIPLLTNAVYVVVGWLYFALMESSKHQGTLGKMAVGLKVTNSLGEPISFGQASGRFFAKFLSQLTCGIGYIMAGFTSQKQALHDMVASTLVMKKPK